MAINDNDIERELAKYRVYVAGVELQHPFLPAAGFSKLLDGRDGVKAVARSAAAAVMLGSITEEPRTGYGGNDYLYDGNRGYSWNARGLPNLGLKNYQECMPEIVAVCRGEGKPLFVSVAGFSGSEYARLADFAWGQEADVIELNVSCPNLLKGADSAEGCVELPLCYNPELLEEVLDQVEGAIGKEARVAVKLSYFLDPTALAQAVKLIVKFKTVRAITAINTIPVHVFNKIQDASVPSGLPRFGALGGSIVKPYALRQVGLLRQMCPPEIDIIGVGGVATVQDFKRYKENGAVAVQVGTALFEKGVRLFDDLLWELLVVEET